MSVDGTWKIDLKTPMGKEAGTLDLRTDGSSLTGTMSNSQGSLEISDGSSDGDTATFQAKVTTPMRMTMTWVAKVDGDAISGTVKLGMMGKASFKGSRAS
ncbi:MAG: hypothetical protein JWM64_651 [Frankiales bacterium]|nr:hypothetical protein [Frankiales bacterium]